MPAPPDNPELIAVLAVERENRVQCQAPGCGHGVHRSIHVVSDSGRLVVLGSTCSGRLFGLTSSDARYKFGDAGGRRLSEEERRLLLSNTAALLERFVEERRVLDEQYQLAERDRSDQRQLRTSLAAPTSERFELDEGDRPWTVEDGELAALRWSRERDSARGFSAEEMRLAKDEVRASMLARGVRAELLGRDSFVTAQAEILLRRRHRN